MERIQDSSLEYQWWEAQTHGSWWYVHRDSSKIVGAVTVLGDGSYYADAHGDGLGRYVSLEKAKEVVAAEYRSSLGARSGVRS